MSCNYKCGDITGNCRYPSPPSARTPYQDAASFPKSATTAPLPTNITTPASRINNTILGEVEAANKDIDETTKKLEIVNEAIGIIESINNNLLLRRRRRRRRQTLAVVEPISNCDDFSTKYNHLLNNMTAITDDNIETVKQLTTALTNTLKSNSGIPCDSQEKKIISDNTSKKVDAAKEKIEIYAAEKIKDIAALSNIGSFTAADQETTQEPENTDPETTANQETTADSETIAVSETTAGPEITTDPEPEDTEKTTVPETTTDSETSAEPEDTEKTTVPET